MNFVKLVKKYSNEDACKKAFKVYREQQGIICCKCKSTDHYWQQSIEQYQCKECRFRTTLRSGTILESSKLPYHYWFIAIIMLAHSKKSISALELQRLLEHKRYEPIWAMLHKIRKSMGNRDSKYCLENEVELDDAFIIAVNTDKKKKESHKRGRGSARSVNIVISTQTQRKKGSRYNGGKRGKIFRYVKMKVIKDASSDEINSFVSENISPKATVKTDGWRGFNYIDDVTEEHLKYIVPPKQASKILPWVHIMIANLKRNLLGIYHNISENYTQDYLNEFCYKTNRTKQNNLFDNLLMIAVEDTSYGKNVYKSG